MARSSLPSNFDHTIPKKEAEALKKAVCMTTYLQKIFELPSDQCTLFVDSQICLHWMQRDPLHLRTLESNVAKEFQQSKFKIRYVPTKDNPSDLVSRGCPVKALLNNEFWWNGPSFLKQPEKYWPPTPNSLDKDTSDKIQDGLKVSFKQHEQKLENLLTRIQYCQTLFDALTKTHSSLNEIEYLFEKRSSYAKIIRIIAYSLRFMHKQPQRTLIISPNEFHKAEKTWLTFSSYNRTDVGNLSLLKHNNINTIYDFWLATCVT